MLLAAFGGELPPVLWDGLGEDRFRRSRAPRAWSLNLTEARQGLGAVAPVR